MNRWLVASPFNYAGLFQDSDTRQFRRIAACKRREKRVQDSLRKWGEKAATRSIKSFIGTYYSKSNDELEMLTGIALDEYGYV